MPTYRHTQIGFVTLGGLGMCLLLVGGALLAHAPKAPLLAVLSILILTAGVFASLTVELRGAVLIFWFGPGLLRKRVQVATIHSCRVVSNPWWYGWEIRWTPRGWLYNVSGLRAVELSLTNGQRLRIGTDQPEQLCQAIEQERTAVRV